MSIGNSRYQIDYRVITKGKFLMEMTGGWHFPGKKSVSSSETGWLMQDAGTQGNCMSLSNNANLCLVGRERQINPNGEGICKTTGTLQKGWRTVLD